MRFRTRLLVCGFEEEQSIGQPHYPEERWWVHAAAFSAQGPYSLPWWPVPEGTRKGDLFVLRLAPFEVPPGVRAELGERRFEFGKGEIGRLASEAVEYTGFGLFGGGLGDQFGDLPDHPEFDPARENLGDGLIGLAVAHSDAVPIENLPDLFEALVGTFVPFPDVIPESELSGRFGAALNDLTTPMKYRQLDQVDISPAEFRDLLGFIFDYFRGDPELIDSTLRLKEVAARLGQPMSYFPTGLSPSPRWYSQSGSVRTRSNGSSASDDDQYTSFSAGDLQLPSEDPGPPPPRPSALETEDDSDESIAIDVGKVMSQMTRGLMEDLGEWFESDRAPEDIPSMLERITTYDGDGNRHLDIPSPETEVENVAERVVRVMTFQSELLPLPSVSLLIDERELFLLTLLTLGDGEPPEGKVFTAEIPEPGVAFGGFEEIPLGDGPSGAAADGPYGREAAEIVEHAANDLVGKLRAWAESPRSPDELPPEMIMFDGGEVWQHRDLPSTEIKRPSLEDRLREIFPILVEMSPIPTVVTFLHRKKLYLLLATCAEPEVMNLALHRFEIPPPGQPLGRPEDLDISKFTIV